MPALEKKVISFLREHIITICFIFITIISFLIRYEVKDVISNDAKTFLLPWYEEFSKHGFHSLTKPIGNYGLLYQFIFICFAKFPTVSPLYAYKIVSVIADYILAFAVGYLASASQGEKREKERFLLGYSAVLLSPIVFFNSACWGQCDSIYTAFALLSLVFLSKEKYLLMFLFYGIAFSFKLQAVFLLPFFLLIYLVKRSFSITYFIILPVTLIASGSPAYILGRRVLDVFSIYSRQVFEYSRMSFNYPSFWCLFVKTGFGGDALFFSIRNIAILFTAALLVLCFSYWIYKNVQLSFENMIYIAFLSSYTAVLFLPLMHERYGFLYEILGILVAFYNCKSIPLLIALNCLTAMTYGNYLFKLNIPVGYLASLSNLAIYVSYFIIINKDITKNSVLYDINDK